jgi:hypothetical protein
MDNSIETHPIMAKQVDIFYGTISTNLTIKRNENKEKNILNEC